MTGCFRAIYKREDVRKGFCEFSCDSSSLCIFFLFFFLKLNVSCMQVGNLLLILIEK